MKALRAWLHPLGMLWLTHSLEFLRSGLLFYIVMPFVVIGALGYIGQSRQETVRVAIADGPGAEHLANQLLETGELQVVRAALPEAEAWLQRGTVALVVVPTTPPQLIVDPGQPEHRLARYALTETLARARGERPTEAFTERRTETPGRRYVDFLVPGVLAFILIGSAFGVSQNLVEDRQRGLLKQYAATPMRRWQYLVAHALMRMSIALFTLPIIALAGWLIYGVTVRGSLALFIGFLVYGMLMLSGIGFIMGSRFQRTEETHAVSTLVNMPQLVLSGAFFALEGRFPDWLVPFLHCLPTTAYVDGLRAIMNEGASFASLAQPLAVLTGWGLPTTLVALKLFRWK